MPDNYQKTYDFRGHPNSPPTLKYNEQKILEEVLNYIHETYNQHYVGEELETFEFLADHKIGLDFARGNATKYVDIFGKKGGNNIKDFYKAIHYIIMAIWAEEKYGDQETKNGKSDKLQYRTRNIPTEP